MACHLNVSFGPEPDVVPDHLITIFTLGLTKMGANDFAWSFDSQLIDWSGLVIRALTEGACGITA